MATATLSGNEITDAVRTTATEGDGRDPESSVGIWEATTNLITNGGAETNITGWVKRDAGMDDPTRVTSASKFGSASAQFVHPSLGTNTGVYHAFGGAASTEYTVSAWIKAPAEALAVRVALFDDIASFQQGGDITPDGTWQRATVTATTGAGASTFRAYVIIPNSSSIAGTFNVQVDGMQVEAQPIATPYVETDGATASRSASRVQIPATLLDDTQAWIACRFRVNWDHDNEPASIPAVFDWADDGNNYIRLYRRPPANNDWLAICANAGTVDGVSIATTFSDGDMVTAVMAWESAELKLSIDGSVFSLEGDRDNAPTLSATEFDIGSLAGSNNWGDFDFFWFACGTGTLTDADAAAFHGFGNTASINAFNRGSANPTFFWPADTPAAEYFDSIAGGGLLLTGVGAPTDGVILHPAA